MSEPPTWNRDALDAALAARRLSAEDVHSAAYDLLGAMLSLDPDEVVRILPELARVGKCIDAIHADREPLPAPISLAAHRAKSVERPGPWPEDLDDVYTRLGEDRIVQLPPSVAR